MSTGDAERETISEAASDHARAMAILPDGEARYRTIVETAGEGIALALPDGRFLFVNRRFAEMLGYEPDEIVGMRGTDLTFDDWKPQVGTLRAQLLGDEVLSGEFKFRRRDGTALWTRWNATAIHDDAGAHVANIALHTDITEHKRTEEALRQSEDLFRYLFDNSTVGNATGSLDGRILRANNAFATMLGYEREELEGMEISRLAVPGDEELVARNQAAMLSGADQIAGYRRPYLAKDGSVRWGDVTASLRRGSGGEPLYFISSIVDVTTQVAAAQEIERLTAMRDIAERVAAVGSARFDPLTGERLWSPQMYRLLDVPPDAEPLPFEEILMTRAHPEDRDALRTALSQALRGEMPPLDTRVRWRDGRTRILHCGGGVERDADGNVVAVVGYLQDVTERREAERQLRAAEAARAAALERERIARDLHDAVTQNLYSANLLLDVLPAVLERDADKAAQDVLTLRRLVRASLGELRALLYELRPETLTSAALAVLLERLGDALAGSGAVEVATAADDDLILPEDVHVTFYRVAQEALANAGRHAGASHVSAAVGRHDDAVRLVVRDDGAGFDQTLVAAGMGLRSMRERAEDIGARLTVESTPGAGTTVTLLWPGAPAER